MQHDDYVQHLIDSYPEVVGANEVGIRQSDGAIIYEFVDELGYVVLTRAIELD